MPGKRPRRTIPVVYPPCKKKKWGFRHCLRDLRRKPNAKPSKLNGFTTSMRMQRRIASKYVAHPARNALKASQNRPLEGPALFRSIRDFAENSACGEYGN